MRTAKVLFDGEKIRKGAEIIEFEVPAADFVLKHIFECGQCFRWERDDPGSDSDAQSDDMGSDNHAQRNNSESYIGIAGGRVARISIFGPDRGSENETTEKTADERFSEKETKAKDGNKVKEKAILRIEQLSGPKDSCTKDSGKSDEEADSPTEQEADRDFWINYFDLRTDYGRIKEQLGKDEILKKAIPFGHGIRILKQDPWETTVSFIISQNNNIPRIKKNIRDLAKLTGKRVSIAPANDRADCIKELEWYEMPTPQALSQMTAEDLAPVRLGYRARYLIETAQSVCERSLEVLTDDLDSLCGVGPKVASCIRLFGLNQISSFPIDVWVKRVMSELYGIDKPSEMKTFAEKAFGEYGGIAQQYLFYYMREKRIDKNI